MPSIFLHRFGPLLLVLHALSAMALLGAAVHQAVIAVLALRGRARPRLGRVYGLVALCLYCATFTLGALLYPRYRYFVRALYLDRHAPWAANLFDLKENLATIGVPLALGAFLLGRDLSAVRKDRLLLCIYAGFALGLGAVCLFDAVAGLLVAGVHGA